MGERMTSRARAAWQRLAVALLVLAAMLAGPAPALAADLDASLRAVVKVRSYVAGEARSARTLGTVREGTGVV
ncbi:MAG: hypothetical protein AB7O45_14650, partial [Alphaproteobacteria bacterium]